MFFVCFGCGENPEDNNKGEITPLSVVAIITDPKSPSPGETVLVTASISSNSLNTGEFPTLSWTCTGGTFLETNQLTVRWVAPQVSQLYTLTVQAENSVSRSSMNHTVFVGEPEILVAAGAGELHSTASGDSIYYLTPNPPLSVTGFSINLYIRGSGSLPVSTANPGLEYSFSGNLTGAAHSMKGNAGSSVTLQPYDIYYDDLASHTQTKVTFDQVHAGTRHTQYTTPAMSEDGSLITYEFLFPYATAGSVDTFDVNLYNINTSTETDVTARHGIYRRNYYPTFSTDGNWLMFVSDRTSQMVWEYYGLPITGGSVPLDSASVVRITSTGGRIGHETSPAKPMKEWNPNPAVSVLAVVDYTGALYIVDPNTQTSVKVAALSSRVVDLKWSANGDILAVSTGYQIYIIDYSAGTLGEVNLMHEGLSSDMILDLAWSRDGNFLVYRVKRSNSIWYELYDYGGSTGLTKSVIITPAHAVNSLTTYASLMSTRPAWTNAGELYFLLFDSTTPMLCRLDLSGAVQ